MNKSSVNKTHAAFFVKNYKFKPICRYLLYFYSTQQNSIAIEIKMWKLPVKYSLKNKPQHKLSMSSQKQQDILNFLCFS